MKVEREKVKNVGFGKTGILRSLAPAPICLLHWVGWVGDLILQVFVSDKGFVAVYPMKTQSEFQDALHWFCKQVGVPITLVVDGHKAQTSNKTKQFCLQVGTTLRVLERGTPWANRAELYIGLLKEAVRKDIRPSNSPNTSEQLSLTKSDKLSTANAIAANANYS